MSRYVNRGAFCRLNLELVEDEITVALAGALNLSIVEAAGYIGMLVCLGISKATDNGLLDLKDVVIERECLWPGRDGQKPGELAKAFKACGILRDFGSDVQITSDIWVNYCFDAIKKRDQSAARQKAWRERQKAKKLQEYKAFSDK